MHPADSPLDDELRALLAGGHTIEAIRRYREATGAGLKEAKDAVEALQSGLPLAGTAVEPSLELEIARLMARGEKIAAVKRYRETVGGDLKAAKDTVEAIAAARGIVVPTRAGCLGTLLIVLTAIAAVGALLV